MAKRKRHCTGVSIAGHTLRIVALSRTSAGVSLSALVCVDLPQAQTSTYLDEEWRNALQDGLQRAQRQATAAFAQPLLALDNSLVHLKRRPLLPGPPQEQRQHLLWEAGHFLHSPLSEYGVDCALGTDWGFVVAVRRSVLAHYSHVFKAAGMAGLDYDIAPFALANALEGIGLNTAEEHQLIIDVSASGASAALLNRGILQDAVGCTWERGLNLEAQLDDLGSHLQPLLETDGKPVKPARIWLTGAASLRSEWLAALQERFPGPTEPLDPFRGLNQASLDGADSELLEAAPAFAVPAGLAYRGISP
ncbi:MAG: hypothetical protein GKR89_25425 [Candidatus Latescibacteria bacterium]|nr:hypothetical protein [Candidatus Latescibacterota bacterium]